MLKRTAEVHAADLMCRDVRTVRPDCPLDEVIATLLEHGISNAPVVEGDGPGCRLLGFVSERDCLAALADESFFGETGAQSASTIMRRHPVCVSPETELFALSSILTSHGFRHLPVTEDDKLVGIVSRRDVLRSVAEVHREALADANEARREPPDTSLIVNHRFLVSR